ncbi:MAG TPA: DivIVA domain-containing protein [Actinomycetota bacterium]
MSPAELDLPVLLTPEHIRRREFVTTRRGYDPDQVRDYLEQLAMQVEDMAAMVQEARFEADSALQAGASGVDPYETLARRVSDLLRSADQEAARIRREAGEESDRVLREARAEADRVRLDAQTRAEEARAEAERHLRRARERADRTIAGLSTRRDELVQQLSQMQERVIGVAKELEDTIERPDAGDDVREIPDAEPGRPAPIADTWAGWAEPTVKGPGPQGPPPQQAEELFTSSETVDLTFPEIPPLDLGWDDEDD